jgi:hypothetical protein
MRCLVWMSVLLGFASVCTESAFAQQTMDAQIASLIAQIKKKASLKLDPTTSQAAIDSEAYELKRLSDPALIASVSEDGANALAAQQLGKAKSVFSNPRFTFSHQAVEARLDYKGTVSVPVAGALDVDAELHAQLTPTVAFASADPNAEFRVQLAVTSLDISSLKLSRNGKPMNVIENGVVEVLASGLLLPAQVLLNHVEFRVPTIVPAKVDLRPIEKQGVSVEFDPKSLTPHLQPVGAAFLLDRNRLTVMAQDAPPVIANGPKPVGVGFEAFRDEFVKALKKTGASWIDRGQFSAYVETDAIQRVAASMLASGPVCMQAKVVDYAVPVHDKLTLPPESSIDCTPTRDCTPTKDCSQTIDCAQHAACGEVCTFRAFRHCVTHGHDLGCEAGKAARKLGCETEKERRRVQCEADKVTNKASCEALKTSEKDTCEGLKQAYKSLRGTGPDYANVNSDDLRLSGDARVCLTGINLESKTLRLTAKLQGEGAASASGKITFTPLNVIGHVMCFTAFDYRLSETVRVTPQPIEIDTGAQFQGDAESVAIGATITNPVHIQFPFRAIAAKLAGDPKFQLECPIPGVATKLRVLTPDQWWPKIARGDIDKDFPSFAFKLDLFKKPIDAGGVPLSGKVQRTSQGVGGVFYISPSATTSN